jgi:hypothetical protein
MKHGHQVPHGLSASNCVDGGSGDAGQEACAFPNSHVVHLAFGSDLVCINCAATGCCLAAAA